MEGRHSCQPVRRRPSDAIRPPARRRPAHCRGCAGSPLAARRTRRVDDVRRGRRDQPRKHRVRSATEEVLPTDRPVVVIERSVHHDEAGRGLFGTERVETLVAAPIAEPCADHRVGNDRPRHEWRSQKIDRHHDRAGTQNPVNRHVGACILGHGDRDSIAGHDTCFDQSAMRRQHVSRSYACQVNRSENPTSASAAGLRSAARDNIDVRFSIRATQSDRYRTPTVWKSARAISQVSNGAVITQHWSKDTAGGRHASEHIVPSELHDYVG